MDGKQWRRKVFQDGGQTKSRRPITRGAPPQKKKRWTFQGDITAKIVEYCRNLYQAVNLWTYRPIQVSSSALDRPAGAPMPSYLQERHAVIQSFMPRPKRKAPLFRILGGQLPPCPPSSAATDGKWTIWNMCGVWCHLLNFQQFVSYSKACFTKWGRYF